MVRSAHPTLAGTEARPTNSQLNTFQCKQRIIFILTPTWRRLKPAATDKLFLIASGYHSSLPTAHSPQLTAYCSQRTAHSLLLTAYSSQLTAHCSQLTANPLTHSLPSGAA